MVSGGEAEIFTTGVERRCVKCVSYLCKWGEERIGPGALARRWQRGQVRAGAKARDSVMHTFIGRGRGVCVACHGLASSLFFSVDSFLFGISAFIEIYVVGRYGTVLYNMRFTTLRSLTVIWPSTRTPDRSHTGPSVVKDGGGGGGGGAAAAPLPWSSHFGCC